MSAGAQPSAPTVAKIPRKIVLDAIVPASGSINPSIQIPSDCDFELWWYSIFRTSGLLKLLLNETGVAQRPWIIAASPQASNFQGIFVDNMAGLVSLNGAFPEAVPYVMPANRVYQLQLFDSSAETNTFQLALHGYGLLNTGS